MLHLAPDVLNKSHLLQDYDVRNIFVRKKINSRWDKVLTDVYYYGFIAVIKNKIRLKIIIKEVAGGEKYFWSIIPFWKMNNEGKKRLFEGNLEED